MANKKGKTPQDEPPSTSQEDQTDEIYDRVADRITQNFDERFTRIEEAIAKMATANAAPAQTSKQKKRPATQDPMPMDTRNKALRMKYNPQMTEHSVNIPGTMEQIKLRRSLLP